MSWLDMLWTGFVISQIVCFAGTLLGLGCLIVREYYRGNDLTYVGLMRLVWTCAVLSVMGAMLPLFVWVLSRTGDVDVTFPGEYPSEYQTNSIYHQVGNEKILLHGSASVKTLRALTADWE